MAPSTPPPPSSDRFAAFTIDANNLLMARDHAGLNRGHTRFVGNHSLIADARLAKTAAQCCARFILSDNAKGRDGRAQRGQICCDVSGAAKAFALLDEIHYRNSSFRRKPRRGSP